MSTTPQERLLNIAEQIACASYMVAESPDLVELRAAIAVVKSATPVPASTGREPMNAAGFFAEARRLGCKGFPDALEMAARDPVTAPELDVEAERLLRAAKVYAFNYMQDEAEDEEDCVCGPKQHAEAKEVFEAIRGFEEARAARSAAQSTAPVSTEQAGDAWGVGSCGCQACNPHMVGRMMFICATCGDKRCPHAADHRLNCQGRAPSPNNSPVGADRRE